MITVLSLVLIGTALGVGCLVAARQADRELQRRAAIRCLAERERRRSEARLQQITQEAVAQMLAVARQNDRADGKPSSELDRS